MPLLMVAPQDFQARCGPCTVRGAYREDGKLSRLQIILAGEISRVPSTSNNKVIRTNPMGRPFVAKNSDQLGRLESMTKAYADALLSASIYPGSLSFGADRTFVLVRLSAFCSRCDTHNMSKPICDWLQSLLILSNDKHADCLCVRAEEVQCDPETTCIDIVRAEGARAPLLKFLRDIAP